MQVKAEQLEEGVTCGCGRSPTGKCCGWHGLTEDEFAKVKAEWEANQSAGN